jgi:hypothetical protein
MESSLPLAEYLRRESHRICALILNSDLEWIDIAIQIGQLREKCAQCAPDKLELFDAIYLNRFNRLWEQWSQDRSARLSALPWEGD